MFRKYSFWLKTAAILQILTAMIHSTGFFVQPEPKNGTEKQLIQLMDSYEADLGLGFSPTMSKLFLSMSICFTLLYLLGGCLNFYLLRSTADIKTVKGTTLISLIIFGISFLTMAILTFLPPIVMTGLVFMALLFSYLSLVQFAQRSNT